MKEKLKYFHPAFHSTTPEGLNSRLTFLLQCIRPGDTIPVKGLSDVSDLNARNTSFGPPPICILRVGDFYHSKVIIRDVNITFDENVWDLNPEGIGVQPMIANVSLQVSFIGGQGLSKPVERLQNALSSNFFANTEMYDERSINTAETIDGKKRDEFTKEFLEKIRESLPKIEDNPNNSKGDNFSEGYIGKLESTNLVYTELVDNVYKSTENYFEKYISLYHEIVKEYGPSISSFILHPNYRDIKQYEIYNTTSSSAGLNIELFGEYQTNRQISYYVNELKKSMLNRLKTTDICQIMELDRVLPLPKQNKANELLQPYFKSIIETKINSITDKVQVLINGSDGFIKQRDEVIESLDKVNFLVKYGYDAKISGTTVTKCELLGFTYNLLYDEYDNCIEHYTNNTNKLYEDLDTTINFNNPTITTSTLSELLSVLLKEKDKESFKNVFLKDTLIFDENIINKIERKYDSFISEPTKDKKFKLKKLKKRKNNKEISFAKSTESEVTDDGIKSEVKKLKDKNKTKPINNKLNYFNSWVEVISIDISFL